MRLVGNDVEDENDDVLKWSAKTENDLDVNLDLMFVALTVIADVILEFLDVILESLNVGTFAVSDLLNVVIFVFIFVFIFLCLFTFTVLDFVIIVVVPLAISGVDILNVDDKFLKLVVIFVLSSLNLNTMT